MSQRVSSAEVLDPKQVSRNGRTSSNVRRSSPPRVDRYSTMASYKERKDKETREGGERGLRITVGLGRPLRAKEPAAESRRQNALDTDPLRCRARPLPAQRRFLTKRSYSRLTT